MNFTQAQYHASKINVSRMLEYARAMTKAKSEATLIVNDAEVYQFWFPDDSKLTVDQVTCTATVQKEMK